MPPTIGAKAKPIIDVLLTSTEFAILPEKSLIISTVSLLPFLELAILMF